MRFVLFLVPIKDKTPLSVSMFKVYRVQGQFVVLTFNFVSTFHQGLLECESMDGVIEDSLFLDPGPSV